FPGGSDAASMPHTVSETYPHHRQKDRITPDHSNTKSFLTTAIPPCGFFRGGIAPRINYRAPAPREIAQRSRRSPLPTRNRPRECSSCAQNKNAHPGKYWPTAGGRCDAPGSSPCGVLLADCPGRPCGARQKILPGRAEYRCIPRPHFLRCDPSAPACPRKYPTQVCPWQFVRAAVDQNPGV